jgi:Actinobacteria/chloroflexi VLRF1 release factor
VAGFAERHGPLAPRVTSGALVLTAADGAIATVTHPWAPGRFPSDAEDDAEDAVAAVVAAVTARRCVAVLLVRRGGYAAALVETSDAGRILASKAGTRHVQGRTAAGGWSQQRFARRREKQTGELVAAAADVAARLLVDPEREPPPTDLATGGDRTLVDRVLADPRLRRLAALPRGPHLAVGDPKRDVVRALPDLLTRVTVLVPQGSPT